MNGQFLLIPILRRGAATIKASDVSRLTKIVLMTAIVRFLQRFGSTQTTQFALTWPISGAFTAAATP
jgi:hypothetical protein